MNNFLNRTTNLMIFSILSTKWRMLPILIAKSNSWRNPSLPYSQLWTRWVNRNLKLLKWIRNSRKNFLKFLKWTSNSRKNLWSNTKSKTFNQKRENLRENNFKQKYNNWPTNWMQNWLNNNKLPTKLCLLLIREEKASRAWIMNNLKTNTKSSSLF